MFIVGGGGGGGGGADDRPNPSTQFQLATLNINKEHKTVESSKLYYLIN
jgi:hypothetical protein